MVLNILAIQDNLAVFLIKLQGLTNAVHKQHLLTIPEKVNKNNNKNTNTKVALK